MANTVPKFNVSKIAYISKNEELKTKIELFISEWNNDNEHFTAKTSGSTGIPKEIQLTKKIALQSVQISNHFFSYQTMKTIGLCLSPDTIGGKMQVLRALYYELELAVFDNERNPIKNLNQRLDFITLVPLQVDTILNECPEKLNLCGKILIGGAKLSASSIQKLNNFNYSVFESYGMTETYSHIALKEISSTYFQAIQGVSFSMKNENLVIDAPQLEIKNLHTNDCVNLIDDTHFELLGRSDFVINSGAYKFHPEILERKLEDKLTNNFFILGEKEPVYGEIVTFYIEKTYSKGLKTSLEELFKQTFSSYERPKKMYFVPEFVKTESGKINKLFTQKQELDA